MIQAHGVDAGNLGAPGRNPIAPMINRTYAMGDRKPGLDQGLINA